MVNWLAIINWEDWPFVLEKRIWGVCAKHKELLHQMLADEYLIFYVRPLMQIRGIYRVVGNPYLVEEKQFINGYKFPMTFEHVIHLRESVIPDKYLDFRAIIPYLDFFSKNSSWMLKLQGRPLLPLTDHDYRVIRKMLKTQIPRMIFPRLKPRSGAWKTFRSFEGRRASGLY